MFKKDEVVYSRHLLDYSTLGNLIILVNASQLATRVVKRPIMSARNCIHLHHTSPQNLRPRCVVRLSPPKVASILSNGIYDDVDSVLWDGGFGIGWMQYLRAG